MKNFSSIATYHFQKHFTLFLLFTAFFYSILASVSLDTSMKFFVFPKTALCSAKTTLSGSNTTVTNADSLSMNTLYENTLNSNSTQYYCLFGQENGKFIYITLKANEIPSLSFQLFDSIGTACSPSSYQYEPSNQVLQIKYYFSANENYLFTLSNLSSKFLTYTIKYEEIKEKANTTKKNQTPASKPKNTPKQKKVPSNNKNNHSTITSKQKDIPKQKKVPSNNKNNHSTITSKQKNTPKPSTSPINNKKKHLKSIPTSKIQKITLSKNFLQIPCGKTFSLKAIISSLNKNTSCKWLISDTSALSNQNIKDRTNHSIFTARAKKKGIIIITCRTKKFSASCTVKII